MPSRAGVVGVDDVSIQQREKVGVIPKHVQGCIRRVDPRIVGQRGVVNRQAVGERKGIAIRLNHQRRAEEVTKDILSGAGHSLRQRTSERRAETEYEDD